MEKNNKMENNIELKIENVTKNYGNTIGLNNFSFTFTKGVYGILGPNGAGKSTLMNLLTDNIQRTSGEILYNNMDILKLGKKYRKILGYMPQQQGLYELFSPYQFLLYIASLKDINKKQAKSQAEELLDLVNLKKHAYEKISSFSGGMKQRVHLAQALLGDPSILILDEPTAGLDPSERINIRNMITDLSKDKVVIYSTHIVSDIESIADEVLLLKDGILVKADTSFGLVSSIKNKVIEKTVSKNGLLMLRKKYPTNNVIKSEKGLQFRIVSDNKLEGFETVNENISLEDVYLYYCR